MPASRCISVSMSPSARSSAAIWPRQPVGRQAACPARHGRTPGRRGWHACRPPVCGNRGSGRPPTAAARALRPCASLRDFGIARQRRQRLQVGRVVARTRPGPGGGAVRLSSSGSTREKSRSLLRQHSTSSGSKLCASTAATTSSRQRRALGGGAEGAVAHAAPGAAGDLGHLGRGQPPRPVAVELAQAGEGDVVHVHVQAHADGVGGDQEIDLLVLVQRHLGVAGARATGAPSPPRSRRAGGGSARRSRRPRRR